MVGDVNPFEVFDNILTFLWVFLMTSILNMIRVYLFIYSLFPLVQTALGRGANLSGAKLDKNWSSVQCNK